MLCPARYAVSQVNKQALPRNHTVCKMINKTLEISIITQLITAEHFMTIRYLFNILMPHKITAYHYIMSETSSALQTAWLIMLSQWQSKKYKVYWIGGATVQHTTTLAVARFQTENTCVKLVLKNVTHVTFIKYDVWFGFFSFHSLFLTAYISVINLALDCSTPEAGCISCFWVQT